MPHPIWLDVVHQSPFGLISIKVGAEFKATIRPMTRALFHIRTFFVMLVLSSTMAFGVAPAVAIPATECIKTVSAASDESKVDTQASDLCKSRDDCSDIGYKAGAGHCGMSCFGVHCCGFGVLTNRDNAVSIHLIAAKWVFLSEVRVAGLGPCGDFRPPRHIG
jgi:hypothetical protein